MFVQSLSTQEKVYVINIDFEMTDRSCLAKLREVSQTWGGEKRNNRGEADEGIWHLPQTRLILRTGVSVPLDGFGDLKVEENSAS